MPTLKPMLRQLRKMCLLSVGVSLPIIFSTASISWVSAQYGLSVHNVSTGLDYATIQEAIDAPETLDEHTILVDSGTYHEHVTIDKAVRLIASAQNGTVIDGNGTGAVITATADNVKIEGFTVQNGEQGIRMSAVQNASAISNKVFNCSGQCIFVHDSSGCVVANNTASSLNNMAGIYLWESKENLIINNTFSDTRHGIYLLAHSKENTIANNFVTNNGQGIALSYNCDNNTVLENTATLNVFGIVMGGAQNNTIYRNNVFDNSMQAWSYGAASNHWSEGVEGNYWSDYKDADLNLDGIGDTPYVIDETNRDEHPLMGRFYSFTVVYEQDVFAIDIISNSTLSDVHIKMPAGPETGKAIAFNATGEDNAISFCRVMIPTGLLNYPYTVLVDGEEVDVNVLEISNSTHAYIYFNYSTSTREVLIIPETATLILHSAMSLMTLTAVAKHAHHRGQKRAHKRLEGTNSIQPDLGAYIRKHSILDLYITCAMMVYTNDCTQ